MYFEKHGVTRMTVREAQCFVILYLYKYARLITALLLITLREIAIFKLS